MRVAIAGRCLHQSYPHAAGIAGSADHHWLHQPALERLTRPRDSQRGCLHFETRISTLTATTIKSVSRGTPCFTNYAPTPPFQAPFPTSLKANEEVGRKVRGDDYGVLEGYWYTEMGPLNQVMHLWRFDSFEERARLRGELGKVEGWTKEYVPRLRPLLTAQSTRFLINTKGNHRPGDRGKFLRVSQLSRETRCRQALDGCVSGGHAHARKTFEKCRRLDHGRPQPE